MPEDNVNYPSHYVKSVPEIEPIEVTQHFNFCLGNVIKYVWRADMKGGIEDLEKAQWYLTREIVRRRSQELTTVTHVSYTNDDEDDSSVKTPRHYYPECGCKYCAAWRKTGEIVKCTYVDEDDDSSPTKANNIMGHKEGCLCTICNMSPTLPQEQSDHNKGEEVKQCT